ncbi:MAG: hypothetical protein M0Q49_03930 [Porticoccaceae bacterium]|nr:hypothetical protein [Porticoccaceae bacterium]
MSRISVEPAWCFMLWLLLCAPVLANMLNSAEESVNDIEAAVIYPQVREPFAALYRDYLAGIQTVLPETSRDYVINGSKLDTLSQDLTAHPPEVIIALGNKSVAAAVSLNGEQPVVGLVANRDYEASMAGGILLRPSAEVYLESLLAIYKDLSQVFVVYNPTVDQGLLDEAQVLAAEKGIILTAREAYSIREAAAEYRQLLLTAPAYSAIWLLPDHGFLDSALLSTILDVAWERKLIVFSSNPLFVKHGALFAVYPDNRAVGMMVARIAVEVAMGERQPLQPLRDVRLAVNERTLNHLGLRMSADVRSRIDLMLPGR